MVLHWGWLIAIYLFFGGLGAGSYLTSFAAEKGLLGDASSLTRVGYYVSAPLVGLGAGLLIFDLGQGLHKPWLIIGMFLNYRSVMTWGIYILSAFIGVGLVMGFFAWKRWTPPAMLGKVGAFLALSTCAYTGLLLAVVKAVPFWNFYLLPVLFLVSALSTGVSLTSILAHFEKGELKEGKGCQAHLILVGLELALLTIFFKYILSGAKGPEAIASADKILHGSLSLYFWGILITLGLVGPFFLYIYNLRKISRATSKQLKPNFRDLPVAATSLWEGEAIAASSVIEDEPTTHSAVHHGVSPLVICLGDGAVLLGGLVLRCLFVFAAVPVWNSLIG